MEVFRRRHCSGSRASGSSRWTVGPVAPNRDSMGAPDAGRADGGLPIVDELIRRRSARNQRHI